MPLALPMQNMWTRLKPQMYLEYPCILQHFEVFSRADEALKLLHMCWKLKKMQC